MSKLPLNALRTFALALERGGVRPAARELQISHSAVSRHVAELEKWLGVRLVDRQAKRFLVTPQGRRLASATLAALDEIAQSVEAIREHRPPFAVNVSTTPSFAVRWLLPRLPALQQAHPKLEVSVLVDQRIDDSGSIAGDLAIRMGRGPWQGVAAEPLMDEVLYPVMSSGFWERSGCPSDPAKLRRLPLLHDRDPNATWQLWRRRHGPSDLDVRSGPRFASSDLVLRAAAHGLGVALARHRLVEDDLRSGSLVRPFAGAQIECGTGYWIITPLGSTPREAAKTMIAWLRREAAVR